MTEGALDDLVVLDLTHYIAGPFCTKLLADYGATVIKIERPDGGDPARRLPPFFQDDPSLEKSGVFLYLNTNKKGITLNLKTETGRALFRQLVRRADIVVESFSPRVMPGWGLDYEALAKINPRLVMTSISNFGQSGPYKDYKTTDLISLALGGWLYFIGEPDRYPVKPFGRQSQHHAGLQAAVGTLTAVQYQQRTGLGQHVDISIMEAVASILEFTFHVLATQNRVRTRDGSRYFITHPLTILPCKDGHVAVTAIGRAWELASVLMELPQLVEDPRLADPRRRREMADEIDALMSGWLMQHEAQEIFDRGQELRVPIGLVPTIDQVVNDPQHRSRDFFTTVDHPTTGPVEYPGPPVRMYETPWRAGRAPLLGEHNEEVFCGWLGLSKEHLLQLRERNVI